MRSFVILCFLLCAACGPTPTSPNSNSATSNANANSKPQSGPVPVYTYEIVNTYPHDPKAFTQGLIFHDGFFYEGTGGSRRRGDDFYSSLRKVEVKTGKVLQKFDLAPEYFGEGITLLDGKLYQLTWQEQKAFVYDLNDFKLLQELSYSGEGWGLTTDGMQLYMSDGTHVIRVVNPADFKTVRTIPVLDEKGQPIMRLNELEWVKGEIWANVWETGWIMRIDPASGKLLGRIDFNDLMRRELDADEDADVLNGIAFDPATDKIYITGKKWRRLFEITVKPK
jgi:glutaminyl-peptide cyclotransferase